MSVELVNGHVLLPHPANWATAPEWSRRWESVIADGVTGPESRNALRVLPRAKLSWSVSPKDNVEQNQLDDRMRQAAKSGLACAPYWGRSAQLAAAVTSVTVTVVATVWPWAVGDFVFLLDAARNHDVRTISAVAGNVLTISAPVSRTYAAGRPVWPLMFGKFVPQDVTALTSQRGEARLEISELAAPANATVGEIIPVAGQGVGVWVIGTTLAVG